LNTQRRDPTAFESLDPFHIFDPPPNPESSSGKEQKKRAKKNSKKSSEAASKLLSHFQPPEGALWLPLHIRGHREDDPGDDSIGSPPIALSARGEVLCSLSIVSGKVAQLPAYAVGKGREEPNRFPRLPTPFGRLDPLQLMFNPFYLIRHLIGANFSAGLFAFIGTAGALVAFFFAGPHLQAALAFIDLVPYGLLGWPLVRAFTTFVTFGPWLVSYRLNRRAAERRNLKALNRLEARKLKGKAAARKARASASSKLAAASAAGSHQEIKNNEDADRDESISSSSSNSGSDEDGDDDEGSSTSPFAQLGVFGIVFRKAPPYLLTSSISSVLPLGVQRFLKSAIPLHLLISTWLSYFVTHGRSRSTPHGYKGFATLVSPPYFTAFLLTKASPRAYTEYAAVLFFTGASVTCCFTLLKLVQYSAEKEKAKARGHEGRMRLVYVQGVSRHAEKVKAGSHGKASLLKMLVGIVIATLLALGGYYLYFVECDERVSVRPLDKDGHVYVLSCDGDPIFRVNPRKAALDAGEWVYDKLSDGLEAVQDQLGLEDEISKLETYVELALADWRCPAYRAPLQGGCDAIVEKAACERSHDLWVELGGPLNKSSSSGGTGLTAMVAKGRRGEGRTCCGGEWYCKKSRQKGRRKKGWWFFLSEGEAGNAPIEETWYSEEEMLTDAINAAIRKNHRCGIRHADPSLAQALAPNATWHCSGTIADTMMPCIWWKGSCHAGNDFRCNLCD